MEIKQICYISWVIKIIYDDLMEDVEFNQF